MATNNNYPAARENHGESNTALYEKWASMKARTSPKWKNKQHYYDKGIRVCKAWQSFLKFKEWALNNGYGADLELDRIKNHIGYRPSNCRFVDNLTSILNRTNSVTIKYKGKAYWLVEICNKLGKTTIEKNTIRHRIKMGWPASKAIDTPVLKGNYGHKGSIPVINVKTGEKFASIKEAAESGRINPKRLSAKLSGKRRNNTDFIYNN